MSDERRRYYRYPPNGGSETVVVRHQGVERPARLVNLSADGFRLDMDEESIVEVGDVVLMATSNGFHRVRVMNVARDNGTLQLGLQRLQDLPANAVESQAEREGRPRRKLRANGSVATPVAQLLAPVALGAMILGAIAWTWTSGSDPVATVVGENGFETPTSDYTAKRRRQAANSELRTAASERPTRRSSESAPARTGSVTWSPLAASGTSDGAALRSDRADASARETGASERPGSSEFADAGTAGPGESITPVRLFDPRADATASLRVALNTANRENKRVLVEFGANTCDSCSRLNAVLTKDAEIAAAFQKAFVLVLIDMEANEKLVSRYLQEELREPVPFLALLNKDGKVLKRRRTDDLEAGSKLDLGKVKEILAQWAPAG
jgi:Thioredoxin-like